MNENYEEERIRLAELLCHVTPEKLQEFLAEQGEHLLVREKCFADYMRQKLREKGLLQQDIFLAADLSENYGYKLIAEEKHTRQRDVILRICLAAHFSVSETEEALILYGMAPLHVRNPRDIVLMTAINNRIYDVYEVNELLLQCNQKPLIRE